MESLRRKNTRKRKKQQQKLIEKLYKKNWIWHNRQTPTQSLEDGVQVVERTKHCSKWKMDDLGEKMIIHITCMHSFIIKVISRYHHHYQITKMFINT